jgi:prevent-host-death family protein
MNISLTNDIEPLSEFRKKSADFIKRLKKEKQPIVLTQHGKSSELLIDVEEYQKLLDKVQFLEDLSTARKELDNNEGISHEEFFSELGAENSS